MLFYISSVINLVIMTLFQFYFAKEVSAEETDFVFLCVGLTSVLISMSTAGFSGYLISSFSSRETEQDLLCDFSNKFSFLIYTFGLLSLIVSLCAIFWGRISFNSLNFIDLSVIAIVFFLYSLASSSNIFFQSYSFTINKYIQYEVIGTVSLLVTLFLVIYIYGYSMMTLPIVITVRLILTFLVFSSKYMCNKRFFFISLGGFKKVFLDVRLMLFGGALYKSEPLIDRLLVSNISGAITVLHLVMQVYNALLGLLFKVYTSKVIVDMSRAYNSHGQVGLLKVLYSALLKVIVFCFFCFCVLFFTPVLDVIMSYEIFSVLNNNENIIKVLFLFFLFSFVGQVVSNAYYVSNRNKTPVFVSTISFIIFLPIKFYFTYSYGFMALAWLIVAYHFINTFTLSVLFRKL